MYQARPTTFTRIEAESGIGLPNILHIMDAERPDQYRGVPFLAHIIEELLQVRRYTEGELTAAIIQNNWTGFVYTESPEDILGGTAPEGDHSLARGDNEYELGPGTINYLRPNERVTFEQPTHPQTGFKDFVGSICDQMGAAKGIPSDLLLKKFGESYSASRAELLEAWKTFSVGRKNFENDFCRPIYRVWFTEAVALGRINAPGFFDDPMIRDAYLGCEWIGPTQGQLDPVKEMTAALMGLQACLTTHEIEAAKYNGSDFNANVQKLKAETAALSEAGITINIEVNPEKEGDDEGKNKKS